MLSRHERAIGMAAVERVRCRHRGLRDGTFDTMYPAGFWEARAADVEAKTRALVERFGAVVDDAALRRELLRICRTTRSPDRLEEMFESLGNDPVRIKECLVRPLVVDRLLRHRVEEDPTIQRDAYRRARELARDPGPLLHGSPDGCLVEERTFVPGGTGGRGDDRVVELSGARWTRFVKHCGGPGTVTGPEDAGTALVFRVVVSVEESRVTERLVTVPKVDPGRWWAEHRDRWAGGLPETLAARAGTVPEIRPAGAGWEASMAVEEIGRNANNGSWDVVWPFPGPMTHFAAVWTGSEMLAFGSADADEPGAPGGVRFDPANKTWTPMDAPSGASPPHQLHGWRGIWTGSELFVIPRAYFRPSDVPSNAWLYDPATDTWRYAGPLMDPSAPSYMPTIFTPQMVWMDSKVLILGFEEIAYHTVGVTYDPVTGLWKWLTIPGTIQGRENATLVWTGSEAIRWGGLADHAPRQDVAYNPATDTWRILSSSENSPTFRIGHTAVWTGDRLIVWGGRIDGIYLNTGVIYDPSTDTWTAMTTTGAPPGRWHHAAIWTGDAMMVWGGEGEDVSQPGWLYDPSTDTWTAMDATGQPGSRTGMALLWTGDRAIVWGGEDTLLGRIHADGATWSPGTGWSTIGTPLPHPWAHFFASAWTGNEFLVWGGHLRISYDWYGWRYEPATGSWAGMSTTDQPTWRMGTTGVWTGDRFIVWGGRVDGVETNTGGLYDPVADTWSPTSTANAPSARSDHTAVWTGDRMIVWGGAYTAQPTPAYRGDGAAYDPSTDSWTAITTTGAPSPRRFHTAYWDGTQMIVWGGEDANGFLDDGARYVPSTDTWFAMTSTGAPSARSHHTVIGRRDTLVTHMTVWGGSGGAGVLDDGSRYDLSLYDESWTALLHDGTQPAPRTDHTAVSTGAGEMIVWGGGDGTDDLASGGIFSFSKASWRRTDEPSWLPATSGHAACWDENDDVMLAWGGTSGDQEILRFHPCRVPEVEFYPGSDAVCPGDDVFAEAFPDDYDSFSWSPGGSTDSSQALTADETVTYSVDVTCGAHHSRGSATLWVPPVGDVNRDGRRTPSDHVFLIWKIFGFLSGQTCPDIDSDGSVDARDIIGWIMRNAAGWN